jgi:tetratricopeptide (TPR) repeat protein
MTPILQLLDLPQTDHDLAQTLPSLAYLPVWQLLARNYSIYGSQHLKRIAVSLQALEILIELDDIDRAEKLLRLELNGQNSPWLMIPENNLQFHAQIHSWGYSREAIKIYEQLCDHPKAQHRSLWHLNMGYCYRNLADYPQAQQCFETALALVDQADTDNRMPLTLGCQAALISAYGSQGDYETAVTLGEQAIKQFWPVPPSDIELRSLHSCLATAYACLYEKKGDPQDRQRAESYFDLAMAAALASGNQLAEALELGRAIHWEFIKGNFDRAINCGQQFLAFEIDNPIENSAAFGNLGVVYGVRGQQRLAAGEQALGRADIEQSISHLTSALTIAIDIEEVSNQIWLYCNLSDAHLSLGQIELAQDYFAQAERLISRVNDRRLVGNLEELRQNIKNHIS